MITSPTTSNAYVAGPESGSKFTLVTQASMTTATNVIERRPFGNTARVVDLPYPVPQRIVFEVGLSFQTPCLRITTHPATELSCSSRLRRWLPEAKTKKCMVVKSCMRDDFKTPSTSICRRLRRNNYFGVFVGRHFSSIFRQALQF